MAQKNKKVVLLDVHAILHRAYHALPDFKSSKGEATGALYGLCSMLIKMIKDLSPDYIVACYDLPEPTKRHELYVEYKAGRKKADDELIEQLETSKDVFTAMNIPIYSSPGFEADDILGTIVKKIGKEKNLEIFIVSGDMDTLQLVSGDKVKVYTLKKGIKDTIIYNEKMVEERFGFGPKLLPDYKGLRGDPSDNIIGIPGIGEKTAEELISKFGTIEDIYKNLKKGEKIFIESGIKKRVIELLKDHEEEAQFSKMLATIRDDAPINFNLPEIEWKKELNIKKIKDLFSRFDFRTLSQRLFEVLSIKDSIETENYSNEDLNYTKLLFWIIDSNNTNSSLDEILSYTKSDNISEANKFLEKIIKDQNLSFVLDKIEKPLTPILEKMKEIGVKIDCDKLRDLSKKYHNELSFLEKKIWDIAGEEFNIASPKQLGEILFVKMGLKSKNQKKTSTGGFSTKESELEKLKEENPIAGLVLDYRELAKLLGTYIDTIPDQVDKKGRLHADFLQTGTTTGRMSSQNPNLQNIPNRTDLGREIRKSFVVEKGFKLVSFDYSQIELRIAAFLSEDQKLIEIFKTGQDVHSAVASEVFGVPIKNVTKEMRGRAKVINFGVMYGMGVTALQKNIGAGREEAQKFLDDYFQKFSNLANYLEKTKQETTSRGYTETYFGRRRYFPDIRSRLPFLKAQAERMAINAPIQGTEADIIKLAMVEIDSYIQKNNRKENVKLIIQVHDELVYEIREDTIDFVVKDIKNIMENIINPKDIFGIVTVTNVSLGDNWGEMKEIKI